MRELLLAHGYRCGAAVSKIRVNTERRAKDDGCDGWSPKPSAPDEWLGNAETCWQFKAGSAGQPAKLAGEVTKRGPKETLKAGGRFVVVASGSKAGRPGEKRRLKRLREEAKVAGLPADAIEVLGSERLTTWCNQHPAVAALCTEHPEGLWRLDDWLQSPEHLKPWQSTPQIQQDIRNLRDEPDLSTGSTYHLHIQGPPGVGKTRFVMELCRDADWRREVVYFPQAADLHLSRLLDSAAVAQGVQLVVVADEAQDDQLRRLCDSVDRGNGRIRLITIGHSRTPDPKRIPEYEVRPFEKKRMSGVVEGWFPSMPREYIQFVVRFADGYVRLAWLAACEIERNPSINVGGLLDLPHIRMVLDSMLGPKDRVPLYVVAVLSHIGWREDLSLEGEAVAKHLGQDWIQVCARVENFDRQYGIVPRGGRYRYISPTPLGNYLAREAWSAFPDQLRSLPSVLPTEAAREAYDRRFQAIASNPHTQSFAQRELSFFVSFDDFIAYRDARRWSVLCDAGPDLAAERIRQALSEAELELRERIEGRARREVVSALVRLASRKSSFDDAVTSLALLAEAENETWANNATSEFVVRFRIVLAGTAVPYADRLPVLDELLSKGKPVLSQLVVKALTQVANRYPTLIQSEPFAGVPEPDWQPTTQERLTCFVEALGRLTRMAKAGKPELQDDLVKAAGDLTWYLQFDAVRELVVDFYESVRDAYPATREPLRRLIADHLQNERKYKRDLSAAGVEALKELHSRFEDSSLGGRLHQYVGQTTWDPEDEVDLTPLASELIEERGVLVAQWPWLTSGEAGDAWRLGRAIAQVDETGELNEVLPTLQGRGRDLRLLSGFVQKRRKENGDDWFDDWVSAQLKRDPSDTDLLFEVSWRCGATVTTAQLIAETLRQHDLEPAMVGQLGFGGWGGDLPFDSLFEVLHEMSNRGHKATAVAILDYRLLMKPQEMNRWDDLAMELVTDADLIRSERPASGRWSRLADRMVSGHARSITAAILNVQAESGKGADSCYVQPPVM